MFPKHFLKISLIELEIMCLRRMLLINYVKKPINFFHLMIILLKYFV